MPMIVVTQSNYLPWKGYFDQIRRADQLIILDCVQFTRRDWRNRNKIKTPNGPSWITVPVQVKGRYHQAIDETVVQGRDWVEKHIRSIESNYKKSAAFDQEGGWLFGQMRAAAAADHLSHINRHLLEAICLRLNIRTPIEACDEVLPRGDLIDMEPSLRLLELCKARGATRYLSGPAARSYLNVAAFEDAGIEVEWMDYHGYPQYPQLWGQFESAVSVVDVLLNVGAARASELIRPA